MKTNMHSGVLLAALALLPSAALAQTSPGIAADVPVIVTTGQAVLMRAPDRAWVSIAAESRARTAEDAQRANVQAMAAVNAKIKAAGVPDEAIQTTGYNLQPEFDYANGRQTLRDYLARNEVRVRVDALDKLGQIIAAAVASGATNVSGVSFDLKDRDAVEREALGRAVADATARAAAAAAGGRVSIARVVRIEEQREADIPQPRPMAMTARMAVQDAQANVPVEAGQIEIRSRVVVTSEIK